jgi:hypothetical protein
VAYEVWVHEWIFTPGHYFNEMRSVSGSPPFTVDEPPTCRDCGHGLERR